MTDFKREERYIVVKIKDLTPAQRVALQCHLEVHGTPTRECVVVEPDWAIYDETWENVQRLEEGRPSIGEERDALAAYVKAIRQAWPYRVGVGLPQTLRKLGAALDEPPSTSLARIKAGWQASALEVAVITAQMKGQTEVESWLQDLADTFRSQAEGGADGEA